MTTTPKAQKQPQPQEQQPRKRGRSATTPSPLPQFPAAATVSWQQMPLHPAAAHAARQLRAAVRAHIRLATGSRPPLSPDRFGNAHLPHGGEDMAALVVDTRRAFEQLGENDQQLVAALCVEGQPLAVAAARAGISQRTAMRRYPECLSFLAALLWPYA